jgi:membrane-associated protein
MLFGLELTEVIGTIGVLGVIGIIFAETGLMIGFFLPGDTLLFAAGILTAQGVLTMNIHLFVFLLIVAAIAGFTVSYEFGRRIGPRLFTKRDSLLFHQDNLVKAERFYEKYGPMTIFIARFIPWVRTFAPIVAGVGKMNYNRFFVYNIVGAVVWITVVTYLGYYANGFLKEHGLNVETIVMPVVLAVVFISLLSPLVHILKEPKSRNLLLRKLRLKKHSS